MLSFIKTLLLISTLCFADGRVLAGHRKQVYSSLRGEVQARRLGANSVQMEQKERQAQSREAQQRQTQSREARNNQTLERWLASDSRIFEIKAANDFFWKPADEYDAAARNLPRKSPR
eukprot:GHVH01009972.1.p1 GENE.GHVH01009972.1~~GHVH01009972.1.p1  ORF type:complete len:118 (+),score=12.00 GHVH01009972.1:158-511(+)